jgi:hypothetical protein
MTANNPSCLICCSYHHVWWCDPNTILREPKLWLSENDTTASDGTIFSVLPLSAPYMAIFWKFIRTMLGQMLSAGSHRKSHFGNVVQIFDIKRQGSIEKKLQQPKWPPTVSNLLWSYLLHTHFARCHNFSIKPQISLTKVSRWVIPWKTVRQNQYHANTIKRTILMFCVIVSICHFSAKYPSKTLLGTRSETYDTPIVACSQRITSAEHFHRTCRHLPHHHQSLSLPRCWKLGTLSQKRSNKRNRVGSYHDILL